MFNRPTVFVLGAGASEEFGFPLGTSLAQEIARIFYFQDNGSRLDAPAMDLIIEAARIEQQSPNAYIDPAKAIQQSLGFFKSIDDFLDQRRGERLLIQIAKMAIARIILERERNSDLSEQNLRPIVGAMSATWPFKFAQMLVRGRTIGELDELFKNVTFITFNYDRMLERFLVLAVGDACSLSREAAVKLVSAVPIHHVYGSLGKLPGFGGKTPVEYGEPSRPENIARISEGIRTYTESVAHEQEAVAIREAVGKARTLVFLGCGFHEQNMEILKPEERLIARNTRVLATVYKQTASNIITIKERITALYTTKPALDSLHDLTCAGFFDEHSIGMTG